MSWRQIDKQKPMTMELFSSCLVKCTELGIYKLFERLLDEYPELSDKYVKAIEDDNKGCSVARENSRRGGRELESIVRKDKKRIW